MQGSEGLHGGVGPQGGEGLVGRVLATSVSERKGTRKHTVDALELCVGVGIVGDAHAGAWHRQVSLLPNESVDRMRERGLELAAGDFAENILTEGLVLRELPSRGKRAGGGGVPPGGDADRQDVPQRLRDTPHHGHVRHADGRHILRGGARRQRARR